MAPATLTVVLETKPVPVTLTTVAAEPAMSVAGVSWVMVGAGLVTARLSALELPPPGVGEKAVTARVAAVARSLAGSEAVIWVALT